MTEEYSGSLPEEMSGAGIVTRRKYVVYKSALDVYQRQFEKYQAGESLNFKDYRRSENYLFTDGMREPTAEKIMRECGAGYYIIEHLEGRTAVDWSFVAIPRRGQTIIPADEAQPHYERPPRYYQRTRNRSRHYQRTRSEVSKDQLFIQQLERERQIAQERVELERRHQEERRQLEKERDDERFKRLEEKLEQAAAPKREENTATGLDGLLSQIVLKRVTDGDEDTTDRLLNRVLGVEEEKGGFMGTVERLFEKALENPTETMQTLNMARGMFSPTTQPAPQPVAVQTPATPAPPVQPEQLSDTQIVSGLLQRIVTDVVGHYAPAETASIVRDVMNERPHLRAHLEPMLEQGDEELLSTLAGMANVSFESLGRKPLKWVREFRAALKVYGIGVETPAADEAANVVEMSPQARAQAS